jgi:hypothetical protein
MWYISALLRPAVAAAPAAMINPFHPSDYGNHCDTIARQPRQHRLARIFGRPLPAAPQS